MLEPSIEYALHPLLPEKLGFSALLKRVNPEAYRLMRATDSFTLSPRRSRITLLREARCVLRRNVPGDFVEFGVHRGGSSAVLAYAIKDEPNRQLHLFDRWGDLPDPTDEDGYRKEQYSREKVAPKIATYGHVQEDARHVIEGVIGFPPERVHYYPGWYNDTLKEWPGAPIALASVDCDYYESVKPVLALCGKYAAPGAVLIIDDYGHWPGAKRAVHEWLDTTERKADLIPMGRLPNAIIRIHS